MKSPSREGMIKALNEARKTALIEIVSIEWAQGDNRLMPWTQFKNEDLYRKLPQYQSGVKDYIIRKIGKKAFDELLKSKE